MANAISDADKDSIRAYVAAADTPEEQTARRGECAEMYAVSLPTIRAITAWTKIRANKAIQPAPANTAPAEELSLPVEAPIVREVDSPVILTGGEHVEFDNDIKNKWRLTLAGFVNRHSNQQDRKHQKVLCLPGKKCLEIPHYLELGFMPENIVGVEGGDENAQKEFMMNAEKFGIRTFLGDVEEYVSGTDEKFHVVSLDFLGPSCQKYDNITSAIPIAEHALVLLNFMMKRETKNAQYMAQAYSPVAYKDIREKYQDEGRLYDVKSMAKDFRETLLQSLEKEGPLDYIKDIRPGALATQYSMRLGQRRNDHYLFEEDRILLDTTDSQRLFDIVAEATAKTVNQFRGGFNPESTFNYLRGIISAAWTRVSLLHHLEEYKYISRVGKTASPFHSVFMKTHTPFSDYYNMRHTTKFMLQSAHRIQEMDDQTIGGTVRDKHLRTKTAGSNLSPNDELFLTGRDGKTFSSIKIKTLVNDIRQYGAIASKDLNCHMMAGTHIPEIIEIE